MQKYTWTLIGPPDVDRRRFQDFVRGGLARNAAERVAGVISASVTLQEIDAYSSAGVRLGEGERPVDAVLEVTSSRSFGPVREANAYLSANCGHVQGWRMHPTSIFDASAPVRPGARSPWPQAIYFNQRLDGTTPEHFDRNWYVHAGHLDGNEAESDQSRAIQAERAAGSPGGRYIQNRVIEPVTPTAWVTHAYAQIVSPAFVGALGARHAPRHGEAVFGEWPPLIVQGYEHRIL
ncbi:MAG: hypothetical protein JO127_05345 [Caulobacteraceae bacterium]|nr:hypothetical protein [Caulobacteraceae bacterium]